MRKTTVIGSAILIAALVAASFAFAQKDDDDDDEDPVLGAIVMKAPVRLEQGFAAGAKEGQPISGKFELEVDGAQLSVYTAKDGAYSEVIIDHRSGRIAKMIPIVDGNDLVEAKQQGEVMRQAQRSLEEATEAALKNLPGYRAVSATPVRKDRSNVVKLLLTNGKEWKTVYEPIAPELKW